MPGVFAGESAAFEFRLLGPLEVWRDGRRLHLGGERQRALLALLLLHANETVSVARLVDELFGAGDADGGLRSLRVAISRLRRLLDVGDDGGGATLLTRPGGYVLHLDAAELDVARFEQLIAEAHGDAAGDPLARSVRLRGALALWRGPALADLAGLEFAQGEIRRLEELRLEAQMDRIDADLELGRAGELVGDIEALVRAQPLQERLRAQLMLALYRAGRQADALDAYRRTSAMLREELGIEPKRGLRDLEQAILNQDPALDAEPRPDWGERLAPDRSPPPAPPDSGRHLRAPPRRRRRHLALLVAAGAAAGAALGIALSLSSNGPSRSAAVDAVLAIDPRTGAVLRQIVAGARPSEIAIGPQDVWVLNADDGTVSRIDPHSGLVTDSFSTSGMPTDILAGAGALWVGDEGPATLASYSDLPFGVSRYDPHLRIARYTVTLPHATLTSASGGPPGAQHIAVGRRWTWVIAPDQTVVQIDQTTGRRVRTIAGLYADSIVFTNGELWALQAGNGAGVARLDPRTGRMLERIAIPSYFGATALAVGDGYVWVASPLDGVIWRLDPQSPSNPISIPAGGSEVAFGSGAVWAADDETDTVWRIDPSTDRVTATLHVPSPQAIAVGDGRIWIAAGALTGRSGPLLEAGCTAAGPAHPDVRIASDLALESIFAVDTLPADRAILRVLRMHHFTAGRLRVGLQSCDDGTPIAHGPDLARCAANANDYATDSSIVAVIGPSSSDCAGVEIPVLSRAPNGPLALISPLATASFLSRPMRGLTRSLLTASYPHGTGNFLRTIGDDHIQVAADAELARQLGLHRVAVLYTTLSFNSTTQAQWFEFAAQRLHAPVAVPLLWNSNSVASAIAELRAAHVDGLFVTSSALPPAGIQFLLAVRRNFGTRLRVIVTDGLWPWSGLVNTLGPAVSGYYASIAGIASPADLPADGRAAVHAVGGPAWSVATATAAAEAVLAAIARSTGTRRSVLHALETLKLRRSAVGTLAFNDAGEPVTGPVTIFTLAKGAHNDTQTFDFNDATVNRTITPPTSILTAP